ncbi:hypothetical protein KBY25_17195 [Ruegeria pomeroyi]|uniref:Uncharacterized protein n=1 Tax=Ruegeria alba TaxID=2916756 RepID=A0ABS9P4E0_9RHOB|nr:hypothetical protein [Ruegeria alba]MCE8531685.1 hypothetical protein [Ruegeria pomeroyi]MCE8547563.1 hypothetical protein [Ruegeria pomeroyi]MCG6560635.1 hypothetical protein [Ruegeria alba]
MLTALNNALAATAFAAVSLYLWRTAYFSTDWATLALIPLGAVVFIGTWSLTLIPWKARLRLELREESPLERLLTGKLRASLLSAAFTFVAVTVLAWQSLTASMTEALIMLVAFVLSGTIFSATQSLLRNHFHQPFARVVATSLVTWMIALPFTVVLVASTWAWAKQPGEMLEADLLEAIQIGLHKLPERHGWVTAILMVPFGFEAAKLWGVVQLRSYPIVGFLFSLDSALFSFVLCRTAIVITQFVEANVRGVRE